MLTVTIYTTGPGCGKCHMTKTALKAKGIPFTEVDITKPENADAREYVTEDLGYSTAPVVVVEDGTGQDHWCDLLLDEVERVAKINQRG